MKLFNNAKPVVASILLFVILFAIGLFGISKCAHAEAPYVQLSAGAAYVRGPTAVLDLAWTWKSPQSKRDFWKTALTVVGDSTYEGQHAPNNFILRGLYVTGFKHLDLGLGLSWMQNDHPYNGSPVNFNLEIAYRFQRVPVTLTVTHFSNAGSKLPNLGRDLVMVGWRFQ